MQVSLVQVDLDKNHLEGFKSIEPFVVQVIAATQAAQQAARSIQLGGIL
jgi:hypothetical protein